MNKESEDYLDQLLNSVQEQQPLQGQRPQKSKEHKTETLKDTQQAVNRHNSKSQEEFIQEFEEELNGIDEEQLISDFELSLESDLFAGEEEEEEQEGTEGGPAALPTDVKRSLIFLLLSVAL